MKTSIIPVALAVVLVAGCGGLEPSPADQFRAMEAALLSAERISFDFRVVSEGVIEGDLQGSVTVTSEGDLTIQSSGTFIERELEMRVWTDADSMHMVTSEMSDVIERPADTFEAVVVGLTRMGILHNVAQLTTVSPPDHSAGGAAEWVTLDRFQAGSVGDRPGAAFDILVEGEKTAEAVVSIENGLPTARTQVVAFPGGDMTVTEEYSAFRIVSAN